MAVSETDLQDALTAVARIIERYGDAYWPLFDRLEAELGERQRRQARLAAVIGVDDRQAGPD